MKRIRGVEIENAEHMSEAERLKANYYLITDKAISNLQNELEIARAVNDEEKKKLYHIQISMFRSTQHIFDLAFDYATHAGWQDEKTTD